MAKEHSTASTAEALGNTRPVASCTVGEFDEIMEEIEAKRPPKSMRSCCFTINNWTETEFTALTTVFDKERTKNYKYIIGKEIGEEAETPHLQGYVEFGTSLKFSTIKKMMPRAHIERANGNRAQNIKYCSKEGNIITNFCLPRKERLLKRIYNGVIWRPWQAEVIKLVEDLLLMNKSDRDIHWYWEPTGNTGKSFLTKYLFLKYNVILCSGKAGDIFNQVKVFFEREEMEEIDDIVVICDIPRCVKDYISYQAIEKLKDGLINSGKYDGGQVPWAESVVICLSNQRPNRDEMSLDRWRVRKIVDGEARNED